MSVWTHVCGLIYVDHFNFTNDLKKRDAFGNELEKIFVKNAPEGSEGGLCIKSIKGDRAGSANIGDGGKFVDVSYRWSLAIFGDLRDYDDKWNVVDWLDACEKKIKTKMGSIREGIVLIRVEHKDEFVWRYKRQE